jgi:multiple sugar transport system permease protein
MASSIRLSGGGSRPPGTRWYAPLRRFLGKEAVQGYLFIAPWFLGLLIFYAGPLLNTFYNSFTNFDLFNDPTWIGIENYVHIFTHDKVFLQVCVNMLFYVLGSTTIIIVGGLFFASLLNRSFPGNHVFRTIIYVPSLLVGVASGILFKRIFGTDDVGLANVVLGLFHAGPLNWLSDFDHLWHSMLTLVLVNLWFTGGTMLIFLAGLKGIAPSYYEAARVDGAGPFRVFFSVTLPLISPAIVLNTILTLINQIQVFDIPLTFAQKDGSLNQINPLGYHNSLGTFLTYIYQQGFLEDKFGYASALAIVVFLITLLLTLLVLTLARRLSYYQDLDRG